MKEGPVPRLDETEMRKLARDIVTEKVFFTWKFDEMTTAFAIILIAGYDQLSEAWVESVGAMWERYDQAGPRSINGLPVFFSANFLNKEDLDPLMERCKQLAEVLENA